MVSSILSAFRESHFSAVSVVFFGQLMNYTMIHGVLHTWVPNFGRRLRIEHFTLQFAVFSTVLVRYANAVFSAV